MKSVLFSLSILLFIDIASGLKILMYQIAFSNSHMPFSGAIADTLIDRGHVVDKIILVMNPAVKTNGSIRLRNVYRITRKDENNPFLKLLHFSDPFKVTPDPRHNANYIQARKVFCEDLLNNDELIKKLKSESYDVYLTTPYDYCGLGLNHVLKIPSVSAYTATQSDEYVPKYLGFPRPASFVTYVFEQEVFPIKMSFGHRLRNFWTLLDHYIFDKGIGVEEYNFLKHKFPDFPSSNQLFMRLTYVFRNSNEILATQRPESSKIKYIGGITMAQNGNLTDEVVEILNKPSKGTVVFSFGSLFSTKVVTSDMKLQILNAFRAFPAYNFIWKFDEDDKDLPLLSNYTNVFPIKWLPQVPLLNDDRVKLFITHFGMNSYLEASNAGKPMIGIPIFADQFYNLGCAIRKGMALYVDKTNITTEALSSAIHEILNVPTYSYRAKVISAMLKNRPLNPKQELIQAIEYSANHPELYDVLQLESADMSILEYYCMDVLITIFFCLIISVWILIVAIRKFISYLLYQKKKEKKA